ncbi:hypothetical protein S820908_147 [Synechococcus phage S-CAM9]|uniref:Uncharacterized protein n=1 Tax=Synechococcus phage S-CAM9 TaxID=1883369 RepID=A0A1D8KNS4_9CAUD|nr:hypothetical protein BOW85_gp101 [Synechococcus phage S-CAM9]AOV60294.1 hypothetical protein S050808_147 [Synechococcus phage S-CAM9]AOV60522.1 hypothetical protein S820908_147 [Synechococcus phage S-CAM9]AOV60751.1 hypothetical protein N161109_148 [Synechococcus phage S-CAM9]
MKTVTLTMSVYQAAAVRESLFTDTREYTYGPACPERVFEIREVITDLDDAIQTALDKE